MSNSQGQLFPNGPYAPKIPHFLYLQEKADFIGVYVGSIFYGTREVPRPLVCLCSLCLVYYRDGHRVVLQMCGRTS